MAAKDSSNLVPMSLHCDHSLQCDHRLLNIPSENTQVDVYEIGVVISLIISCWSLFFVHQVPFIFSHTTPYLHMLPQPATFHQTFQVPKMEVLNLIGLFLGWVFPYISRIHTAYIGEDSSILGSWKVWWILVLREGFWYGSLDPQMILLATGWLLSCLHASCHFTISAMKNRTVFFFGGGMVYPVTVWISIIETEFIWSSRHPLST